MTIPRFMISTYHTLSLHTHSQHEITCTQGNSLTSCSFQPTLHKVNTSKLVPRAKRQTAKYKAPSWCPVRKESVAKNGQKWPIDRKLLPTKADKKRPATNNEQL